MLPAVGTKYFYNMFSPDKKRRQKTYSRVCKYENYLYGFSSHAH